MKLKMGLNQHKFRTTFNMEKKEGNYCWHNMYRDKNENKWWFKIVKTKGDFYVSLVKQFHLNFIKFATSFHPLKSNDK